MYWAEMRETFRASSSRLKASGPNTNGQFERYYPTPLGALIKAPTLPRSRTHFADIDPARKNIFGIPQLRFHFQWNDKRT